MQAGARVPGSGPPPPPPPGSWRGRESPAAGARLPGALGARRLQSGREQWSRSWCPRGGAGGEGSRPPPGVSRPCGPPLQTRRRRLTLLAARAPSPCGVPAPRRARLQSWYRAPCGAPLGPEKSPRSPLLSSCGERSRRGKARSPQCAKQSLGPAQTLPPSSRHSRGSSARCGWTRVRAPACCRPLLGRHTSARRSAPSAVRRRGARAPSPTPTPR